MNPISKALISKNKAISSALLIMYSLIIALLVMTFCVASSFDKTFNDFFDDYKVFDLLVTTKGTPLSLNEEIEKIDGVKAATGKLIIDKCVEFENGRTLLTRIMSEDSSEEWKIYDVKNQKELKRKENSVMVSAYFANCNNIDIGSKVKITDKEETIDLIVTDIIASPETIGVGSYVGSWYDMRDFGFIFVSSDLTEKVFKTKDICNTYKVLLNDKENIEDVKDELKRIIPSESLVDISEYNESNIKKQLDSSIDAVRSIALYLPLIVIIIGVLFSLLFIYQVTRKSRKDIALLRAIGYSKARVQAIFILYVLTLSIIASLVGLVLGFVALRFILNIYKDFYYIPYVRYDGNVLKIISIIIVINIMAVVSCVIACQSISKIEPALAFNENEIVENTDLPSYISKIKCNPFTKLSLTLIYRNKARVFVVFLCTLACMILTMLSISVIINKNVSLDYTFNSRYTFDLAVFSTNENSLNEIAKQDFVKNYNLVFQNDLLYEDEVMRIEVHPKNSNIKGIILEKGFARRHNLKVGDFIKIKDTEIEVEGIQDQYLCSTQYISFETLKKIGYSNYNVIEIELKDKNDLNKALSYASRIDGFLLTIDIGSIKLCALDTMSKIDMPCYMIVAFSGFIGLIIMYNMALISFDKRRKEFSTLRALGTESYRIIKLLLSEAMGELMVALFISPLCFPLLSLILTLISSTSQEYVLVNPWLTLIISFGFTLLYTLIGVFLTYLSIRKIDIALELNN